MSYFSNIVTYISNSHIPLTETNYNEVDALVLAQLAYYPFEKILADYQQKRITVTEYAMVIMKQKNFRTSYSADEQAFIKELAHCKRYMRCVMHRMQAISTVDTQWAAFSADIGGRGTSIIAMRGTDGTTVGWEENFRSAHSVMGTGAQLASFRYLKDVQAKKIYLTGHSKGGNNVSSAYIMSNPYIRDKVIRIDNFDGPGVNPEFAVNYANGYAELEKKLNNFYPQDSIIGLLLQDNPGNTFFIKSIVRESYRKNPILGQHDPFSFVVKGNAFEKTKQTVVSGLMNSGFDYLVASTTNAERHRLISIINKIGIPAFIVKDRNALQLLYQSIIELRRLSGKEREVYIKWLKTTIPSLLRQRDAYES